MDFLEVVLKEEERQGKAMPLDSLLVLSRLRLERRLTTVKDHRFYPAQKEGPSLPKVELFAIPFMQADPVQQADPGDRLAGNNLSLDI